MPRKKPLDQRFQDTYQFIQTQMAADAAAVTIFMDLRTRRLQANGHLATLIEVMSLGNRYALVKSSSETRRRHYVRSVLMGYATLGDPDNKGRQLTVPEVKAKKSATEKLAERELHALLQRMLQRSMQADK